MTEVFLLGRWRFQPESLFSAGSVCTASGDGWNLCVGSQGLRSVQRCPNQGHSAGVTPAETHVGERGAEGERFGGQRALC